LANALIAVLELIRQFID
ncbi:DinQ-like type I toxin DqlB, partial [Klebsiella variicola]